MTATDGTDPPATRPRIVYLVKRLERLVRRELDAVVRRHGLTTPRYTALSALAAHPGLSSAQLARRSFVTDQSMNEIIIALERDGLIRRGPDPAHLRILRANLTARGTRLLQRCDKEVDEMEARMLAGLTPAEITCLQQNLQLRIAALDDEDADTGPHR